MKSLKKLNQIVNGVLAYWIIFVLIAWITYWIMGSVPDTLIQYGLGGGSIELVVSGGIEIAKTIIYSHIKDKIAPAQILDPEDDATDNTIEQILENSNLESTSGGEG